jgi:hypothetical protein
MFKSLEQLSPNARPITIGGKAIYLSVSLQLRNQRVRMLQYPIRRSLFPLEGADIRIVAPRQDAGVLEVAGQEIGMAEPVLRASPLSPWTATMLCRVSLDLEAGVWVWNMDMQDEVWDGGV